MIFFNILICILFAYTLAVDPCIDGNHNIIKDDHRSTTFEPDADELFQPICDYLGDITNGEFS